METQPTQVKPTGLGSAKSQDPNYPSEPIEFNAKTKPTLAQEHGTIHNLGNIDPFFMDFKRCKIHGIRIDIVRVMVYVAGSVAGSV